MFQFPTFPSIYYFTYIWISQLFSWLEFPHSDIHGSQDICSSPWLFAAYHVLLRLLLPRHPPYALFRLTYFLRFEITISSLLSLFWGLDLLFSSLEIVVNHPSLLVFFALYCVRLSFFARYILKYAPRSSLCLPCLIQKILRKCKSFYSLFS